MNARVRQRDGDIRRGFEINRLCRSVDRDTEPSPVIVCSDRAVAFLPGRQLDRAIEEFCHAVTNNTSNPAPLASFKRAHPLEPLSQGALNSVAAVP